VATDGAPDGTMADGDGGSQDASVEAAPDGPGLEAGPDVIGSDAGYDPGPFPEECKAPATADAFNKCWAKVMCRQSARCGWVAPSNVAACEADYEAVEAHIGNVLEEEEAAGRLSIDPQKAGACLLATHTSTCFNPDYCVDAIVPKIPVGGDCVNSSSCIDGMCDNGGCKNLAKCIALSPVGADCGILCVKSAVCVAGKCVAMVGEGESCAQSPLTCPRGLACTTNSKTCKQPVGQGASCVDDNCAPDLWCPIQTKTCEPLFGVGHACEETMVCLSGLVCAGSTSKVCVIAGDVGSPCDPDGLISTSGCSQDLRCNPATSQCYLVTVDAGAPCSDTPAQDCVAPYKDPQLFCDENTKTCVARADLGEACIPQSGSKYISCYDADCNPTTKVCEPFTCQTPPPP
jgi:hypothetical protein